MNERLLQFIWQNKLFDFSELKTVHDEHLTLSSVGVLNAYDGPDFYDAKIKIDQLDWVGTVEIHCKDTEWLNHGHQYDTRYGSVILHVVWEIGSQETVPEGVPCLILKDYVDGSLLSRYSKLMTSTTEIPCLNQLEEIERLIKIDALENATYLRLRRKANDLITVLEELGKDWQQLFFFLLALALGKKANENAMAELGKRLPVKYLLKHADSSMAIEAMIYGVAGFLDEPKDDYSQRLYKEFNFLSQKYGLKSLSVLNWNRSRTRGISRPELSLAFLSAFVPVFGSKAEGELSPEWFKQVELNTYWSKHNSFGNDSKNENSVTKSFLEHLTINVIVPFLSVKGLYYQDHLFFEKAQNYLSGCKKESNSIVSRMINAGFEVEDASGSQGALELHNEYCLKKRCLDCRVGSRILGRK